MRDKLDALTGLRFFAAALIIFHHTAWLFEPSRFFVEHLDTDAGVTFFYVLSGFILYYAHSGMRTPLERRKYFVARFARIWPLHLAMLLAVLLLFDRPWGYPGETPVLLKFASNLLLLQAWLPPAKYFFSFNGVSWSLSVEAFFYAVFPFLLIGWHRRWWVALGASVLMALAIVRLGDGLDLPNYPYYDPRLGLTAWLPMVFPLVRLPEFLTGMAAAVLWFKMRDARPPRRSAILWSCTEIAALGVAYWALAKLPWVVPRVAQGPITTAWIVRCASGPLFAVLIFVFAFGRGYVSRLIGSRVMVFLGEISFSLYMTHEVLARELVARFPGLLFKGERWTGFLVFWTIEIVLSTALWLAVERPCRRWLIALFRARVSRPALAVEIGSVR